MPEFQIRVGESTYVAKSVDELRQWWLQGRFDASAYVYHPVLEKWLYARDLAELQGLARGSVPIPPTPEQRAIRRKVIAGLVLFGAVVVVGIILMWRAEARQERENYARARKAATEQQLLARENARKAKEALIETQKRKREQLEKEWSTGRPAILKSIRAKLSGKQWDEALSEAKKYDFTEDRELLALESTARKRRDAENAEIARMAGAAARKAYAETIREQFLDKGLDIKATTKGRDNTTLVLSYVLFNDVWSHQFQKGGSLDACLKLGFTRVEMNDGFDWGVYWTFK